MIEKSFSYKEFFGRLFAVVVPLAGLYYFCIKKFFSNQGAVDGESNANIEGDINKKVNEEVKMFEQRIKEKDIKVGDGGEEKNIDNSQNKTLLDN